MNLDFDERFCFFQQPQLKVYILYNVLLQQNKNGEINTSKVIIFMFVTESFDTNRSWMDGMGVFKHRFV